MNPVLLANIQAGLDIFESSWPASILQMGSSSTNTESTPQSLDKVNIVLAVGTT
jgi:hypothetical protein